MIDYHDNGDGYNEYSFSMLFDDYSLDVVGLDNLVYEDDHSLPLLEQPSNEGVHEPPPLLLPRADAELDREMSMFHLLKAYGEADAAAASTTAELARVILARLRERSSPVGCVMERVGHYLSLRESGGGGDPQAELLAHESAKSYPLALRAFYETTPYGRFAHFAANAAVRESVPGDIVSVHIVDFDVGEGVQWPPLLATLGPRRSVRITNCVGTAEEEECCVQFERTKKRLLGFAQSMRLELRVDRMRVEELLLEKRSMAAAAAAAATRREWLVFNCMAGLPHMMNRRNVVSSSQLETFTNMARELIVNNGTRRGVLIYQNGHGSFDSSSSSATRFSDGRLLRAHALFESLESHLPSPRLSVARTAMECLFVGPCVVSSAEACGVDAVGAGLEGFVFSEQSLMEAEEIARRAGAQHYGVGVGGCANEVVLEWRGTPLVRVCAWR